MDYTNRLFQLRVITNKMQRLSGSRVLSVLKTAEKDLEKLLGLAKKETLTYQVYFDKMNAITELIDSMISEVNVSTRLGMRSTTESLTKKYASITREYARGRGFDLTTSFSAVPLQATKKCIERVWSDGFSFSDRIWRMDSFARDGVNQILTSGIARGQSAVSMSKELRRFLIDPDIEPGVSWTTGVSKSVTGKGTIHYNALRLARTEINNAYRETLVTANASNPITLGVRWNLSNSHPRPDICDVWAESDLYGIGAGVYPPGATPLDHPGGLCYVTDVLRPQAQWGEQKKFYVLRNLPREEILAPLKDVSIGQQNAAWKQFVNTQSMVAGEQRQYRLAS